MANKEDAQAPKPSKNASKSPPKRLLDDADYHTLKDVPPESEWLQERKNRSPRTARAYENDIDDFKKFIGIKTPEEYRLVRQKHVSDWIALMLENKLTNETISRKVSAVSSLFKYYCNCAALKDNPCKNVTRPKVHSNVGKSIPISRKEARDLLNAPPSDSVQGLRDRAIIAVFLFCATRRSEAAALMVGSLVQVQGNPHIKIHGKGDKDRTILLNPVATACITAYLEKDKRFDFFESPLFLQIRKRKDEEGNLKPLDDDTMWRILRKYATQVGIQIESFHPHCLRTTFATTALENGADLAMVQEFLGHVHISTTKIYDKRRPDIANSPASKVSY